MKKFHVCIVEVSYRLDAFTGALMSFVGVFIQKNGARFFLFVYFSVADPDPGSGIGCLFDLWIRDPGWEKVSIRIRDPG